MSPLDLALLLTIFVLIVYFIIGSLRWHEIHDYKTYFLDDKRIKSRQYSQTFVAGSTSLATVLFWFISLSYAEGLPIFYAPISSVFGVILVICLIGKLRRTGFFEKDTSLISFVYRIYGKNKYVSTMISLVSIFATFCLVLLEFYIGITIFSIFSNKTVDLEAAALIGLAFIVFLYMFLGGFPGVLKNDIWQARTMWLAAILTPVILVLIILFGDPTPAVTKINWIKNPFISAPFSSGGYILWMSAPLFLYLTVVNAVFVVAQLRTWQTASATTNDREFRLGLTKGAIKNFTIWSLFAIIGLLLPTFVTDMDAGYAGILQSLSESQYLAIAYVVFPLIFIASVAALVSTADSLSIPLSQAFIDNFFPNARDVWTARLSAVPIMLLIVALYFLVFIRAKADFFSVLYSAWGFFMIISPSILCAVWWPEIAPRSESAWGCILSIVVTSGYLIYSTFILAEEATNTQIVVVQTFILSGFICGSGFLLAKFKIIDRFSLQHNKKGVQGDRDGS